VKRQAKHTTMTTSKQFVDLSPINLFAIWNTNILEVHSLFCQKNMCLRFLEILSVCKSLSKLMISL